MKKRSRELSSQMAAKFLSISELKNFIFKSRSKELEASSFNNIKCIKGFTA